jgi:hypothetical protein
LDAKHGSVLDANQYAVLSKPALTHVLVTAIKQVIAQKGINGVEPAVHVGALTLRKAAVRSGCFAACYVLPLRQQPPYLRMGLFDLGPLRIRRLGHHLALRTGRPLGFLSDEQTNLCFRLLE